MNKTLILSAATDQDSADQPQPEARMRAALGLRSDGSRMMPARQDRPAEHGNGNPRRHRFVQEGEVPVEIVPARDHGRGTFAASTPPRARVDEAAIAAERLAREQAERAVAELTDRLRETQTKLGHAMLARDEALAIAAERLAQLEQVQAQLRVVSPPAPPPPTAPATAARKPAAKPATTRKRGRPPAPKPVKWWIKTPSPAD